MSLSATTTPPLSGPITQDWTISDLLDWLSSDDRWHDPRLREPLRRIEDALAARAGQPSWDADPSTVALVRSIATLTRQDRALRGIRIADLLAGTFRLVA